MINTAIITNTKNIYIERVGVLKIVYLDFFLVAGALTLFFFPSLRSSISLMTANCLFWAAA